MAKKKKTSRVSPTIPNTNPNAVRYEELANGECFILESRLFMKYDIDDQEAYDLDGGQYKYGLCGDIVIPVNISVTWKKK